MYGLSLRFAVPGRLGAGRPSHSRRVHIAGACAAALCLATTFGCSALRTPVVMDAIKAGRITGVPPTAVGTFIFPGRENRRKYEQVTLLQNVHIGKEARVGESADDALWEGYYSFVLGRRTSDGRWEIISVAQRADKEAWREVPLNPTTGNGAG